ncbi:MAG: methyltransferase domain-containing protein [Thaumarchaeota archaeon]|nr:methyltransferase domain-containing protein [Nitrososphaerota archaeon]
MPVDQEKLNQFVMKFVGDFGASMHGPNVLIGEQLGLYKAIAANGPMTPKELAEKTQTNERYITEWLAGQAASGYVNYNNATGKYMMSPEQVFTLADDNSPLYFPGAFYITSSLYRDQRKLAEVYRTGKGFGWNEHHNDLFVGTHKFFKPGYVANLVGAWLPSLEGVVEKLQSGARVADVGCGLGSSTIIMAKAFPKSKFIGYDYHLESIEGARNNSVTDGVTANADFQVALAKDFPGKDFDLITFFDCLHDMGDPVGAAKHVRESLKGDGTWMIVEPYAKDSLQENLNPVGRLFYNASSMICVPSSKAQEVGLALGAQASDSRLREVVQAGGFTRFRRSAETPFNRIFEARP